MELCHRLDLSSWETNLENLDNAALLIFKTTLAYEETKVLEISETEYSPTVSSHSILVVPIGAEELKKALIVTNHPSTTKKFALWISLWPQRSQLQSQSGHHHI